MSWIYIASAEADLGDSGATLDCASSLNVAAGDLLVAWCKHEGSNASLAVAKNSGSPANSFTFDAGDNINHGNGDLHASFGYVLSASADATATFRMTLGAARPWRSLIVYQFRPDAGDTVSKNTSATGSGTGTAAASGNISPSGSDLVCIGGFAQYNNVTLSNRLINGVAADGFEDSGTTDHSAWYRLLTTGFTNGAAAVTQNLNEAWLCCVIAFAGTAGGGGSSILKQMLAHN